jgi:SAM-dependent methyltransferase
MGRILLEKRAYPRIKANLEVNVSKKISGKSVNLSEKGLGFSSSEIISSPVIPLRIYFPKGNFEFKAKARLIWKRDVENSRSLYGVEFIKLSQAQKSTLREELMKIQIEEILNEIKLPQVRENILHFFLKDVLNYIKEITKLSLEVSGQRDYSLDLEKRLDRLNTQVLLKGYCLEELISDDTIMQKVKYNFRHLIGVWVYKSKIVNIAFQKPRGYSGDYKILEFIYDNKPISRGLGQYFDNIFLRSPYAVAIRNRKDYLRKLLQNYVNQAKLDGIKILSVGCGSCREIRELLPQIKTKKVVVFTCLDWDQEAIEFSQEMLSRDGPQNVEFRFIKEDIANIIKDEAIIQGYDKYNLIYSMGLIDYLPDSILKKLIWVLYQLLEKEGKLILTHKNKEKTFPPIYPDWLCDWRFIPRSVEEVTNLIYNSDISNFSLSVESDKFVYIHYFKLMKR